MFGTANVVSRAWKREADEMAQRNGVQDLSPHQGCPASKSIGIIAFASVNNQALQPVIQVKSTLHFN